MEKFNPHIQVEPDGLYTPTVRAWSLEKYKLVGGYCHIFTEGMKKKWNQLVYVDLFAGAGNAKIQETGKTFLSSALIAMSLPTKFSKYILCDSNQNCIEALKTRVGNHFSDLDVTFIHGDCNSSANQIFESIPKFRKGNTMLTFCFVDPFSLNLHFKTIETLSGKILMDFLILQALQMDGKRNLATYLKEENERIALYLGNKNWRNDFHANCKDNMATFVRFLADQYTKSMESLLYIPELNMHQIRSNEKNLPLYYLAFYSKHPTGIDFYNKVKKYVSPQLKMEL
jgi:three-Cys-motif partner protein